MIIPPYLQKNDIVAIATTARYITQVQLLPAISIIESWGLKVFIHQDLFAQQNQFGGDDLTRAKVLQDLINNKEIKAIVCARGGYGTTRMIDLVDFGVLQQYPKWIVGFSDVTALHARLNHLKIESLHSIMPVLFENEKADKSLGSLRNTLFGNQIEIFICGNSLNKTGKVEAELVGGNLSIIAHLMGSVDELDTDGKILFIEDLDEYLYHIDRMMVQLKRAGKLDKLAGLIVGHMGDMKDNAVPFGSNAYEIIVSHVNMFEYPICFGFPVGHDFDNMTLISGGTYLLEVKGDESTLKYIS